MKKKYIYYMLFLILFLVPTKVLTVSSYGCPYEELSRLKNIGKNINYDYGYTEKNGNVNFWIRFVNISSDIYIHDVVNNKNYTEAPNGELKIEGFNSGIKYRFIVRPVNPNAPIKGSFTTISDCGDLDLYNIYITTPKYNKYYLEKECSDLKSATICQKWSKVEIKGKEDFLEKIENLKNQIKQENEQEKTEETVEEEMFWLSFYSQYYVYILLIIIVLGVGGIIYAKRNEEGFEGW